MNECREILLYFANRLQRVPISCVNAGRYNVNQSVAGEIIDSRIQTFGKLEQVTPQIQSFN